MTWSRELGKLENEYLQTVQAEQPEIQSETASPTKSTDEKRSANDGGAKGTQGCGEAITWSRELRKKNDQPKIQPEMAPPTKFTNDKSSASAGGEKDAQDLEDREIAYLVLLCCILTITAELVYFLIFLLTLQRKIYNGDLYLRELERCNNYERDQWLIRLALEREEKRKKVSEVGNGK